MSDAKNHDTKRSIVDILRADPVYQSELETYGNCSAEKVKAAEEFLNRLSQPNPSDAITGEAARITRLINVLKFSR